MKSGNMAVLGIHLCVNMIAIGGLILSGVEKQPIVKSKRKACEETKSGWRFFIHRPMLNGNGARRRRNISRSEDRRRIRSKI
jgi:hypothetical protein